MQGVANNPELDKRHDHPVVNRNIESLPGEVWKDVLLWKGKELQPGYQVSNLGRVRSLGRIHVQRGPRGGLVEHSYPPCMMRLTHDTDGYLFTGLRTIEKKTVDARVHQLVAKLFIGEPPSYQHTHVNHIDGNKENNCPSNLEWVTPAENNKHARDTGLARLGTSQAIQGHIIEWDVTFSSKTKTNEALGWSADYIDRCLSRGLPIIDKSTGQEVHVEWIDNRKEGTQDA